MTVPEKVNSLLLAIDQAIIDRNLEQVIAWCEKNNKLINVGLEGSYLKNSHFTDLMPGYLIKPTPLMLAVNSKGKVNALEIIKVLLENGAKISPKCTLLSTPTGSFYSSRRMPIFYSHPLPIHTFCSIFDLTGDEKIKCLLRLAQFEYSLKKIDSIRESALKSIITESISNDPAMTGEYLEQWKSLQVNESFRGIRAYFTSEEILALKNNPIFLEILNQEYKNAPLCCNLL